MKKRGQGVETIVIYVSVAIVTILVLGFGYKAFQNGQSRHYESTMLNFESEFKSDLESIKRNYGSVVDKTYELSAIVEEVCLRDDSVAVHAPVNGHDVFDDYDALVEEMTTEDYNVFLLPKNRLIIPYKMGDMELQGYTYETASGPDIFKVNFQTMCFPTDGGDLHLQLEGAGTRTIVRPVWPVTDGIDVTMDYLFFCEESGVLDSILHELPHEDTCWTETGHGGVPIKNIPQN